MQLGQAIGKLVEYLGRIPPETWSLVLKMVKAVASSDDPARAAQRAAAAAASKAASDKVIREAMRRRAGPGRKKR